MTRLLEKAFREASKLPEKEQDALANWIFEEIASERRWEIQFGGSQEALARLAREALAECEAGQTKPLDPDRL
jgi:hypothetical protein